MALAGDHSTAGVIIGGSLRRAGMTDVIRYACAGRGDVNITPHEVADLKANGVGLGLVVEHEADWLLRRGVADRIKGSVQIADACGVPRGVLYHAADFDVTNGGFTSPGSRGDRQMAGVARALEAAAGVIGEANVGFYGSFYAILWLRQHLPWVRKFWQTEAWSHMGRARALNRHPDAQLFQRATSINVHGVSVDVDEIWHPDYGNRFAVHHDPVPSPKPKPAPAPEVAEPEGVWRATVELYMDDKHGHKRGDWEIQPIEGKDVKMGGHDREWGSLIKVNEKTGAWRKPQGVPFSK